MRYALSTSPQRTTWPWLAEVWKRGDELPVFESGWTFDHIYPLFGDSTGECLDGWMVLAALLHETTRIRGGVLVTGMIYRHPGVLANMAATLDITSGGRLELGVGAGWNEEECAAFGIELGSMRERFDRFEESLAVLESLFTNERTTFAGRYYQLDGAMINPKPLQARLPICIGGTGRRRTLPLTARYADHWNFGGSEVAEFTECRKILHEQCAAIGRDPAEITCSVLLRYTGDGDELQAQSRAFESAGADLGIVSLPKHLPASCVNDVAEALTT